MNRAIEIRTSGHLLSVAILTLRLTIGAILFVAGAGKVMGWFGGFGMEMTMQFYQQMGIPAPLTYLSCYAEFIGGLLIAIGLFTRPAALAVAINMLVATILTLPAGFLGPNAASVPFLYFVIAMAILLAGPLTYSADVLLATLRGISFASSSANLPLGRNVTA